MIPVTCCILVKNNKILMSKRDKKKREYPNYWEFPGGKCNKNESIKQCIVREIKEESGLNIKTPSLKGIITFPKFDNIEDWLVFVFTANQFSGDLIDSDEGNLKWIDDSDLLNLNMWEGDRIFIPWLSENKLFSAKFYYSNNNYIKHEVIFY